MHNQIMGFNWQQYIEIKKRFEHGQHNFQSKRPLAHSKLTFQMPLNPRSFNASSKSGNLSISWGKILYTAGPYMSKLKVKWYQNKNRNVKFLVNTNAQLHAHATI